MVVHLVHLRVTQQQGSHGVLGLKILLLADSGTPPMEPPLLRLRWRDAGYAQTSSQQHAQYE